MGKIILSLLLTILTLNANLQTSCLDCHTKNQIPSQLIYKRYLIKYSTSKYIQKAIYDYLKYPNQKNSIMPSAFFSKFPMKEAMEDKGLEKNIKEFMDEFDVRKRLYLEQ